MNIFLIGKQLVDILHEFTILDYGILIFAFLLFVYKFIKDGIYKKLGEFITIPDVIVFLLMIVYASTFIRCPQNSYKQFVKTISALAVYFLGRVYQDDILKGAKSISIASYLILYVNFFYRIFEKVTGYQLPFQQWEFAVSGGLYFYKTDLLIGITIAAIFIYAFAKRNLFKYISLFVVLPLLAFTTTARMGQAIIVAELCFILFWEIRTLSKKNWHIDEKLIKALMVLVVILVTAFFVSLQVLAIKEYKYEELNLSEDMLIKLENLFHSRHIVWWDALNYYSNQDFGIRAIGIDLWSETLRNSCEDRFHCLYMKMIYSVGYIGVYLFLAFVSYLALAIRKKSGYQIKYMTIAFWMMFLMIGVSMEAFEYTQMSWYPFVFAGAIMSGKSIGELSGYRKRKK